MKGEAQTHNRVIHPVGTNLFFELRLTIMSEGSHTGTPYEMSKVEILIKIEKITGKSGLMTLSTISTVWVPIISRSSTPISIDFMRAKDVRLPALVHCAESVSLAR